MKTEDIIVAVFGYVAAGIMMAFATEILGTFREPRTRREWRNIKLKQLGLMIIWPLMIVGTLAYQFGHIVGELLRTMIEEYLALPVELVTDDSPASSSSRQSKAKPGKARRS